MYIKRMDMSCQIPYGRVRGVCRIFRLPKYTEIAQNLLKLLLQKGNASFHDLFIVLK